MEILSVKLAELAAMTNEYDATCLTCFASRFAQQQHLNAVHVSELPSCRLLRLAWRNLTK